MIPIVTTPHLIGKHPQHEDSLVNSLAQTQSQQQHGSKSGLAYGSSSSGLFFLAGFSSAFLLPPDFLEPPDFLDLASASAPASSAGSPPSKRLSYSLYC